MVFKAGGIMGDKDVERNVRSIGKEGIQTPTQKHFHYERHVFPFEKVFGPSSRDFNKQSLLEKFKRREEQRKKKSQEK